MLGAVPPACYETCRVTADCAAGMRCAGELQGASALAAPGLSSRICVTTIQASCAANHVCDEFSPPDCLDGQTLVAPSSFGDLCGHEYVGCPNGCGPADVDAGTVARCR